MMSTVERTTHTKDCRCLNCKKLLFRIDIERVRVNISVEIQRRAKVEIVCRSCGELNSFDVMN